MASSMNHGRKTLLYSDLFKCNTNTVLEKQEEDESIVILSKTEGSSSSLSSNKSFSCDSSSFDSELGSSESDEGDFMAELARQMAECMLQEDEEQGEEEEKMDLKDFEAPGHLKDYKDNLKYGQTPSKVCVNDQLPSLEVYELKNQVTPIRKERGVNNNGRRVKGPESTHTKTEQHNYMQVPYRGREWGRNIRHERSSGMQAIFLDGSKSRYGSSGTGVFLPRVANDPVKPKEKTGCSTVLIPTRVLQALDLHFNKLSSDSLSPPPNGSESPNYSSRNNESNGPSSQMGNRHANHDVEMHLPQEWTY